MIFQDMVAPKEKVAEANGEPPQVAEEKKAEEAPAAEAEEKKDESKEGEEKKDESKEGEEKKEEPAPTKGPNPVSQLLDAICGLVCKVVGLVSCCLNHALCLVNTVKDKILSLPWDCIISLTTTLGIQVGIVWGGWILTEDNLVFAHPVLTILGKFVLDKLEEKKVLEAKGVHLASEVLSTVQCGIKYYLYRTYIQMPIWDEAPLPAMTAAETSLFTEHIPISAEDGRNGALVFVSAISVLSGVAPIAG